MKRFVLLGVSICICISSSVYAQVGIDSYDNFETLNIFAGGNVIASGYDNSPQYIYEGDFDDADFRTFNGQIQDPAYVGILRNRRMLISEFFFFGGRTYNNGGWFDSSNGAPMIQIMVNPGDPWTDVEPIADYPTLNGTDFAAAQDTATGYHNRQFPTQTFDPPLSCVGFRVAGTAATGDDPSQSFVAVGQLRAMGSLGETVNTYELSGMDGALPIGSNFFHPNEHGGSAVGDVIVDDNYETFVHCQEQDLPGDLFGAYFGFYSANPLTLTSVSFQHGRLSESGGWFNTEGGADLPRVQIRSAPGEPWEDVGVIEDYPPTAFDAFRSDLPANIEDNEWTFTFDSPTVAVGVRFVGFGSFNIDETPFIQCAEIEYEGTGTPAYAGPYGDGRNNDGNPFQSDANGEVFIEAERARSINNAFRIFGHGNTNNGLVIRGNWGPHFIGNRFPGEFSQQIMEFDFEIAEAGDYSVFLKQDTLSGWGDSYFVTMDDQDELTPDSPSITNNEIRYNPNQGTPAGSSDDFVREIINTSIGNFWTLDAGEHTLRIAYREPFGIVDWLLITQDFNQDINAFEPPDVEPPAGVMDYSLY